VVSDYHELIHGPSDTTTDPLHPSAITSLSPGHTRALAGAGPRGRGAGGDPRRCTRGVCGNRSLRASGRPICGRLQTAHRPEPGHRIATRDGTAHTLEVRSSLRPQRFWLGRTDASSAAATATDPRLQSHGRGHKRLSSPSPAEVRMAGRRAACRPLIAACTMARHARAFSH